MFYTAPFQDILLQALLCPWGSVQTAEVRLATPKRLSGEVGNIHYRTLVKVGRSNTPWSANLQPVRARAAPMRHIRAFIMKHFCEGLKINHKKRNPLKWGFAIEKISALALPLRLAIFHFCKYRQCGRKGKHQKKIEYFGPVTVRTGSFPILSSVSTMKPTLLLMPLSLLPKPLSNPIDGRHASVLSTKMHCFEHFNFHLKFKVRKPY